MIKYVMFTTFIIIILSNIVCADTERKICTKKDAIEAENFAASAVRWDQLYVLYKRYHQCDDGAIAEGFSESVSILLSKQWSKIDKLLKIIRRDDKFEIFVLKHIDETLPSERMEYIKSLAVNKCPDYAKTFCEKICTKIKEIGKRGPEPY